MRSPRSGWHRGRLSVWVSVVIALVAALVVGATAAALAGTSAGEDGKFVFQRAVVVTASAVGGQVGVSTADAGASAGRSLDLLWLSDSSGAGAASFFARNIRRDLGVSVRTLDWWTGGLGARTILARLRSPRDPWAVMAGRADVIVVYGSPEGLEEVRGTSCVFDPGDSPAPPKGTFDNRYWQKYVTTLKAIYERIFELRKGKPVILRTANYYAAVNLWNEAGLTAACTKKWKGLAQAIATAAAAYRVPVADVYRAFNGRSRRDDPKAKGLFLPDGMHPNNKGRAIIAKTLSGLGYKPVKPPG